jgi:hypothetical protein
MPFSPRTQQMMQPPPTEEDARQAFEAGFSDMAHNVLASKFPELVSEIATFKIIKSDLKDGSAVGAFLLVRSGENYIIPVILANNQIKPLEIIYAKDKNIFLPLKGAWLDELDRANIDRMGEGVKAPKNLPSDVDIRNLVVPPAVGRYSYASAGPGTALVQFLSEAPNNVKRAFQLSLEKSPKILKYAFTTFDRQTLLDAMEPHAGAVKTAAMPSELVEIFTTDDSAERFRDVFGDSAADAFQKAAQEGVVVKDKRLVTNVAVDTEEPGRAVETKESGFYRVQLSDGSVKDALVIAHPSTLQAQTKGGKRVDTAPQKSVYHEQHKPMRGQERSDGAYYNYDRADMLAVNYMVYTEDGELYTMSEAPVGRKLERKDLSGRLAEIADEKNSDTITGRGFFVCTDGGHVRASEPFEALTVSTDSDGTRRIKASMGRVILSNPKAPGKAIHAPEGSGVTYVPASFLFVKVTNNYSRQPMRSFDEQMRFQGAVAKHASYVVKVKDTGAGMFTINGSRQLDKLGAVRSLMLDVGLRKDAAESILKKTAAKRHHSFFLLKPMDFRAFVKEAQDMTAAGPMPGVPQAQQPPPMQAPVAPDPTMMQGQPQMAPMGGAEVPMGAEMPMEMPPMMPMEPPPPSPVDLAVVELSSELAQQSADVAEQLAEQQRNLATHLEVLEAVKQRADQITQEQQVPMGMPPEQMASEATPFMEQAADLEDSEAFESTAIGSLAAAGELPDMVANYMPNLEEALDNLGRILLSMWMREGELQQSLGEMDYIDLEEKLRNVFNNLGGLILRINQVAMTKSPNEEAIA